MATGSVGYAVAGFLYQLLGTIDFATMVAINEHAVGPLTVPPAPKSSARLITGTAGRSD